MRKRARAHVLVAALVYVLGGLGSADARGLRAMRDEAYAPNGRLGLGLELGAPFGLTGKYFIADTVAIDFGLGADGFLYGDQDGFNAYGDALWHPLLLASLPTFKLPAYIGLGVRFLGFKDNKLDDAGAAFGVRFPIGVALDFNTIPMDLFAQTAVVVDAYAGYVDSSGVGFEAGVGIRFWFH